MNSADSWKKNLEKRRIRDQEIIRQFGWEINPIVDKAIRSMPKNLVMDILDMGKALFEYKIQSISQYLKGACFDDEVYDIRMFQLLKVLEPLFHYKEEASPLIIDLWIRLHPVPDHREIKMIQAKTWGNVWPAGTTKEDKDWGTLDPEKGYEYVCPKHFTTWKLQAAWLTLHYLEI